MPRANELSRILLVSLVFLRASVVKRSRSVWSDVVYERLRAAGIASVAHVPDKVIAPVIERFEADAGVTVVPCTREEEGVGIVAGALLGGTRGALLMQTSGFGNCPNALASLVVPYQLPLVMVISGRGVMGEFNPVQRGMGRAVTHMLDALDIAHHTLADVATLAPTLDLALETAFLTSFPVAFILSPLLTHGDLPENPSLRMRREAARRQASG
jgi:sulfopyruvate decarboxylase alpha subunit